MLFSIESSRTSFEAEKEVLEAEKLFIKKLDEKKELDEEMLSLLKKIRSLSLKNAEGFSNCVISHAAKRGYVGILKYFIEEHDPAANPDTLDDYGVSPLEYAIKSKHPDAAIYLLSKTTVYYQSKKYGHTILHYAADNNLPNVITEILKKMPDIINKENLLFETALHVAIKKGYLACVKLLVEAGADLNVGMPVPFTYSVLYKEFDIMSYLLEQPGMGSAIACSYLFFAISPLAMLDEKNLVPYVTLFEAGAGLDLSRIPSGIISKFKLLTRAGENANWECFIIGKDLKNNSRIYVTCVENFLSYVDEKDDEGNRRYSFKLNQIADSAHHPAIKDLPHIKNISEKLKDYNKPLSKNLSNDVKSKTESTITLDVGYEKIENLSKDDVIKTLTVYKEKFLEESGLVA